MDAKPPTVIETFDGLPHWKPRSQEDLGRWLSYYTSIRIPDRAVCAGHVAPFDMFAHQVLERPSLSLW
ncbi:MAG: hypothetical protein ACP5XB_29300, partial [Isosphaeraceae bacterium]